MKRLMVMIFALAMTLTCINVAYAQGAMYPHPEVETEITVNEEGTVENNSGRVWNTIKGEIVRPDMEFGALRYSVYLPENYDDSIEYPILVYLHGGSMGYIRDAKITPWSKDLFKYSEPIAKCIENCIILAPQAPGTVAGSKTSTNAYWSGLDVVVGSTVDNSDSSPYLRATQKLMSEFLKKGILYKENTYKIDASRLYLAGHSMGGIGSFTMLRDCPDVFAAAIIGAGIGDPDTVDLWKDTPVRIFHGTLDETVVYEAFEVMSQALEDYPNAKTISLKRANHNIKHEMYTNTNFSWMGKQKRDIVTEIPEENSSSTDSRDSDVTSVTKNPQENSSSTEKQDSNATSNTKTIVLSAVAIVVAVIIISVFIKKRKALKK